LINSSLPKATRAQDILSIVKGNLDQLDAINVSTAFSRLGRTAKQRDFLPGDLTADEAFRGLLRRARDFALQGRFPARNLANVFHAIATLCVTRRLDVMDGIGYLVAFDGILLYNAYDRKKSIVTTTKPAYELVSKDEESSGV
jgi:hypothetical protein